MPGSERTASALSIARLMESQALSEEDLFAPRPEEIPRIQNGTVTLLPVEDKQRVLDLLQEVIRFRIEVGNLVSMLRGDAFVRTNRAVGEDFMYVSTQPTEHMFILSRSSFEKPLSEYIYICPTGNIHKPNKETARRISEEGVGRNTQQVPK